MSPPDQALESIFRDMMSLSDDDIDGLSAISRASGGAKTLDQVALEAGRITAEERDSLLRAYLERRVAEMREKLLGAQIGSYHILEEIACGGMGIVFKARQESPMFTRETALKFMLAGSHATPEDRERFVAEVMGLAGLSHPFLVHIFDSGIEGDLHYFSMELIDGWSLADQERVRQLSLHRKVEVARDIARALAYLHENGVVHRDVKPGNIMVDRNGTAKLLDFGIAQFSADARRRAVQAGTPYFMAPEVIDPTGGFGPIGPGTDIYALGAVLYEILFARPVFGGEGGLDAVLERALREPPRFPKGRKERIPAQLERIMARCLRKRVDERYPSASGFADDLEAFLRRSRSRAPMFTAAAAALLLAGMAILFVSGHDAPSAAQTAAAIDLEPWRERLREMQEVGKEEAAGLGETLAKLEETGAAGPAAKEVARLADEIRSFWRGHVQTTTDQAMKERSAYMNVRVEEEARRKELFKAGNSDLDLAGLQGPGKTAYDLAASALGKFRQARKLAEEDQRRREREDLMRDAGAARRQALEARRDLAGEASVELSEEARGARAGAEAKAEEAEAALAQDRFREARSLYEECLQGFYNAKFMGRAGFATKRTALAESLARVEKEYEAHAGRLEKNCAPVIGELARGIERAKEALAGERLIECEKAFAELKAGLDQARRSVDELQTRAEAARATANAIRLEGAQPAAVRKACLDARKRLEDARRRLGSEEYEPARAAFAAAAQLLGEASRTAQRLKKGMVWVTGSDEIPGFWIDRCEVSVREYGEFLAYVQEHGHARCCPGRNPVRHEPHDWKNQQAGPELPVIGVSFENALAHAAWRGKELPGEGQWKLAARRGKDGKLLAYPYGDAFDPRRTNGHGSEDGFRGLAPADSLPAGASACGCLHLSGNAAEWAVVEKGRGVLLGGSYLTGEPEFLRGDARYRPQPPSSTAADSRLHRTAGFRCALRAVPLGTTP